MILKSTFRLFRQIRPLGGSRTGCKRNTDTLSPYSLYGWCVSLQLPIYMSSRHWATLSFIWSHVSVHLMNISSIFVLFLALFWSPPTPEKNIWLFSCYMLHYVHQLVWCRAGSIQLVFKDLFLLKTTACCCWKRDWWELWEWTKTVKVLGRKPKQGAERCLKAA